MITSETAMMREGRGRLSGRLPAVLLGAIAVAAITAVAWACKTPGANAAGTPTTGKADNEAAVADPTATQVPTDTVVTALGPSGFTPNQVSHPASAFNLKVRNQSGEHQVTLQLSDADGKKVAGARLTEKVGEWSAPLDLAAGTYTLSEASHSNWTCAVTVTAQQ
jgi:hypothetical protein